jgi:flagellar basal-body rod protein FlgC
METRVRLDQSEGVRSFDPEHPMADADGYVTMSNVSLVTELADMREANRSYEANLNSFQQARTMYRSLLDVLRR